MVICFHGDFTSIYVTFWNFIYPLRFFILLFSVGNEDPGYMLILLLVLPSIVGMLVFGNHR